MTPFKLFLAALAFALIPSTSHAEFTPQEYSVALFYGAHVGSTPSIIHMVNLGANVNYANENGETAMHVAASRGYLDIVQYLQHQRASLNPRTTGNWIPLHHAVRFGHTNVASYLIAKGAPVDMKTKTGQSIFDMAKATRNAGMIKLLERHRR